MTVPAIETVKLEKRYAAGSEEEVFAVRGVDLTVKPGEIYALLGPNGAGKTTTISMLTTLLLPTGGTARVAGFDVVRESAQVRRQIGVTFQEVVLDEELTGRQVLDFHGQLYGFNRSTRQQKIGELAALVELDQVLDRKAASYSGGMKRRLELARGLMTSPTILFLDEPTQGLDPQNRAGIWRYIRDLRAETGITLLLTTHYMEEAETLADRVGIIDHGQLILEGTPRELVRSMGADVVPISGQGESQCYAANIQALDYVSQTTQHPLPDAGTLLQVGVDTGDRRLSELVQLAGSSNFQISEISVAKPSLGDVFLAHTGHALRDG
ncbi:MAG: ATP-binding cassette domain-containing protein [Caldilineaceae bacterium]|nr:ATP-binding cassette domain-containing protein [Caldilineaceae bacterium]